MKTMKKFGALVLAIVMAMALAVPAVAVENVNLSITPVEGHTYKYFQLFTGDLADGVLSNVKWGSDAADSITYKVKASEEATTYTVEKTVTPEAGKAVPAEVLEYLESLPTKSSTDDAQGTADIVSTWVKGDGTALTATPVSVPTGYYVVKDAYTTPDPGADDPVHNTTLSTTLVEVVGPTVLTPKADTITDDKTITTDTLGKDTDTNEVNAKTDNVSVGDTVNYQITAKIPAKSKDYNYFYFIINDTLSAGLTLDATSIHVYKNTADSANELPTTAYTLLTGDDAAPQSFRVGLIDAKGVADGADTNIIVTYSATLNENAEIGDTANTNKSTVEFSNDPNHEYDGGTDNDNPGFPNSGSTDPMGKTPEVKTETFTTGIKIHKVDENNQSLTGAEFTISGDSCEIVLVTKEVYKAHEGEGNGEYYKLKDGTYTTEAPQTERTMVADPGATSGYVVDNDYTGDDKVVIGSTTYRPYNPTEDTEVTVYKLMEPNTDKYETGTYDKSIEFEQKNTATSGVTATAEVDADGYVIFKGLGAGEYTITETKTPAGYNTIAPLTLTIEFDGTKAGTSKDTSKWSFTGVTGDYVYADGVFAFDIVNEKGTELPETGGIGTKMFYTMGAVLVIGAGVVLVSRKRAGE